MSDRDRGPPPTSIKTVTRNAKKLRFGMRLYRMTLFFSFVLFTSSSSAHHLLEYDERIRGEAKLPAKWLACKTTKDCDLVSVPCQSDLAINAKFKNDARDVLVHNFWFCLGTSQHDSEAVCEDHQCVTKPTKPEP